MKTISILFSVVILFAVGCSSRSQTPPPSYDQMAMEREKILNNDLMNQLNQRNEGLREISPQTGDRPFPDPMAQQTPFPQPQRSTSNPIHVIAEEAYIYQEINWSTTGGGDIRYSIKPTQKVHGRFVIRLSDYDFKKVNRTFYIDDEMPLYSDLYHLFMGNLEISETPEQGLSGSWSSVVLTDIRGRREEIKSPMISGIYSDLFSNVRSYIESRLEKKAEVTAEVKDEEKEFVEQKLGCDLLPTVEGKWQSVSNTTGNTTTSRIQYVRHADLSKKISVYSGTDEVSSPNGSVESVSVKYWYTPKKCRLVQKVGKQKEKLIVYSVGVLKDGKRIVNLEDEAGRVLKLKEL